MFSKLFKKEGPRTIKILLQHQLPQVKPDHFSQTSADSTHHHGQKEKAATINRLPKLGATIRKEPCARFFGSQGLLPDKFSDKDP